MNRTGAPGLRTTAWYAAIAAVAVVALLGVGGCGGGEASTSAGGSTTVDPTPPGLPPGQGERQEQAVSNRGSKPDPKAAKDDAGSEDPAQDDASSAPGGGAADFERKGADNSIPRFGDEARSSELAEAAGVLHDYLDARIAGDWERMCSDFAASVRDAIGKYGSGPSAIGVEGKTRTCATTLEALLPPLSPDQAREAAVAEVSALRVEGDRGFLLFHGAHGVDFYVRMLRERHKWKLGAPAPSQLPCC